MKNKKHRNADDAWLEDDLNDIYGQPEKKWWEKGLDWINGNQKVISDAAKTGVQTWNTVKNGASTGSNSTTKGSNVNTQVKTNTSIYLIIGGVAVAALAAYYFLTKKK